MDDELEELADALRSIGLTIPREVRDLDDVVLAIKANGPVIRKRDMDNADDSEKDDEDTGKEDDGDEEYPGQHGAIQLGHADPAAPYREQIRQHNDAKFAKQWDRTLGRKPQPKAQKGKPGSSSK